MGLQQIIAVGTELLVTPHCCINSYRVNTLIQQKSLAWMLAYSL